MGETVTCQTKVKSAQILQKVFEKTFKWKNIKTITPEEEAKGKDLGGHLYGGKKEQGNTVLVVEKKDLVDLQGRKGYWSDVVATRNPKTGTITIQWDAHNFDPRDKDIFMTEELKKELENQINQEYGKDAIDTHLRSFPNETVTDWDNKGEYEEKIIAVDTDNKHLIPVQDWL